MMQILSFFKLLVFMQVAHLVGAQAGATCGVRAGDSSSRIVNGQESTPCGYPWQVSLRDGYGHFCGGTLIARRWVFSAAHCVVDMGTDMTITVGDHGVTGTSDSYEKTYQVAFSLAHEDYDSNTMEYDFALIKLQEDVELNECVALACMPDRDIAVGSTCVITGWGTLSSGGSSPEHLQEGNVSVLSNSHCNRPNKYGGEITDDMLCAQGVNEAGKTVDACQGDSGGPLVCEANGIWTLHGATSWGQGCAVKRYPGVWSRVYYVRQWADSMMAPVSLPKGQMWEVQGPCVKREVDGKECISSPGYPRNYQNSQSCTIRIDESQAQEIWVDSFRTEHSYDILTINGVGYSGRDYPTGNFVPQDPIMWSADSSTAKKGWLLCRNTIATTTTTLPPTCAGKRSKFDRRCKRKCNNDARCKGWCSRACNAYCSCASRRLREEPGANRSDGDEESDGEEDETKPVELGLANRSDGEQKDKTQPLLLV